MQRRVCRKDPQGVRRKGLRRHGDLITLPQSQSVFLPLLLEGVHVEVAEDLLQGLVAGRVFFLMREELAVEVYQ